MEVRRDSAADPDRLLKIADCVRVLALLDLDCAEPVPGHSVVGGLPEVLLTDRNRLGPLPHGVMFLGLEEFRRQRPGAGRWRTRVPAEVARGSRVPRIG